MMILNDLHALHIPKNLTYDIRKNIDGTLVCASSFKDKKSRSCSENACIIMHSSFFPTPKWIQVYAISARNLLRSLTSISRCESKTRPGSRQADLTYCVSLSSTISQNTNVYVLNYRPGEGFAILHSFGLWFRCFGFSW